PGVAQGRHRANGLGDLSPDQVRAIGVDRHLDDDGQRGICAAHTLTLAVITTSGKSFHNMETAGRAAGAYDAANVSQRYQPCCRRGPGALPCSGRFRSHLPELSAHGPRTANDPVAHVDVSRRGRTPAGEGTGVVGARRTTPVAALPPRLPEPLEQLEEGCLRSNGAAGTVDENGRPTTRCLRSNGAAVPA